MYWILRKEIDNHKTDAMLEGELFGTAVTLPLEVGTHFTPPKNSTNSPKVSRFKITKRNTPPKKKSPLSLRFVTDEDSQPGKMTDHLLIFEIPGLILSTAFRDFLVKHRVTNIQYFDLTIEETQTQQVYKGYKVANLLDVVNCIDTEQSELIFDEDEIDEIDKLVLDESRIPDDKKLFRIEEYKNIILVRDDLKRAIESTGLTGCVFLPPEEFIL